MHHAQTRSCVVVGIEGRLVVVEADIGLGLPKTLVVGLPDTAVNEARERVKAAARNSGFSWPDTSVTINLSPANLHKTGSSLDLSVAIAVLAADGAIPAAAAARVVILGELGLDGSVRHVRGALPAALAARRNGAEALIVPAANAAEAALVPGLTVLPVLSLRHTVETLRGEAEPVPLEDCHPREIATPIAAPDLADVRGQALARHALEVAAAGGHHMAMVGPPGVGKSMLAERLPGLLPDLDEDAALEVTAIHSVAGPLGGVNAFVRRPPFQAPHHTASAVAVVGGGGGVPRVGLISLAHRGVLFLDEAPEFERRVLDALRQPLETGIVTVSRAGFNVQLPARFQLIAAANPCPCGPQPGRHCTCTPAVRRRYFARLSGPLLDRLDVRLVLDPPSAADLAYDAAQAESTAVVADRVRIARDRSRQRLSGTPWSCNSDIPGPALRTRFPLGDAARPLETALRQGVITARGADRVARMAWTSADLAGRDQPTTDDVATAVVFRDAAGRWAA
jgi:magnesium chelatase family protein